MLDTIANILKIARVIQTQVATIKANKSQATLLSQRIDVIVKQIEKLKGIYPETQSFADAIESLYAALQNCQEFITNFTSKHWPKKIILAGTYTEEFASLNEQLRDCLADLNLGVNTKQLLNQEELKKAQQKDHQTLLQNQETIIKLQLEEHNKIQELHMDQVERDALLQQQLNSIQQFMGQILKTRSSSKRKSLISRKLQVNFFDIQFDGKLAEGSFGKIYLGRWQEQEVAIKSIEGITTERDQQEFVREVQIMNRLKSPHITQLLGACFEPKRMCLLMEYMAGGSLYDALHGENKKWIKLSKRYQMALDIAKGLYYLHEQGVIHRDFKSANILLDAHQKAKITDFGLSKIATLSINTIDDRSQAIEWLAPECLSADGRKAYTTKSDVYSFGVILWELFTGLKPFNNKGMGEIIEQVQQGNRDTIPESVPDGIRALIEQCWLLDPNMRPEMFDVIRHLEQHGLQLTNDGEADYRAGIEHEKGKRLNDAFSCYQASANKGYYRGKTNSAIFFFQGIGGVKQDKQKAYHLWLDSAKHSAHPRAEYNVARMLEKGDGVSKDSYWAKFWYSDAAAQKDPQAQQQLARLKK